MAILTNFKFYQPQEEHKITLQNDFGIYFLKSAEGFDWYECQNIFDKDKLKVVFDSDTGKIFSVSKDITSLWPENLSVADVDYPLDTNLEDLTDKVFDMDSVEIVDKEYTAAERKAKADKLISEKIAQVSSILTPLQYAKDLGIITQKESEYLMQLQRYIVDLSRVSSQAGYPENIQWPEIPKA